MARSADFTLFHTLVTLERIPLMAVETLLLIPFHAVVTTDLMPFTTVLTADLIAFHILLTTDLMPFMAVVTAIEQKLIEELRKAYQLHNLKKKTVHEWLEKNHDFIIETAISIFDNKIMVLL